jgi:hypothetical protein
MPGLAARLEAFQRELPKRSLRVGATEWTYRLAGVLMLA